MKKKSLLIRLVVLVTAMMCALGASAAEAYACYTSSNTTLTFYYDNLRSSRTGTTYDLNTGNNDTGWDTDGTKSYVTKVVFDPSFANFRPTTTYDWFYRMQNLESITGMSYLNTSEVTRMGWMFAICTKLTSLDLSNFNTSQVTDMAYMFNGSSNLQTIYVDSGWSTAAVTNSESMFANCSSLVGGQGTTWSTYNPKDKTYARIDGGTSNPGYFTEKNPPVAYACYTSSNTTLTFYYDDQRSSRTGTTYSLNTGSTYPAWYTDGTNANVTKVVFDPSFADARPTTTGSWFQNMENLQSITGMSYLNTSEVTYMAYMFSNCSGLTGIDLSHFNTSRVTTMRTMFGSCQALESLDLSHFNTSQVTNMEYMFYSCANLRTIFADSGWSTAAVTYSSNMFSGCTSLVGGKGTTYSSSHTNKAYAHIDGGPSNPGYFTEFKEAYACYNMSDSTLTFYYDKLRSSRPGTTYDLNKGMAEPGWETDGSNISVTQVVFDPSFVDARPTSTRKWFDYMKNLQSVTGMNYLNTSEVTNMDYMFYGCEKLTSVDLSHFNTSKMTTMNMMFNGCSVLTSLDLRGFYTANVSNISYMFFNCNKLRTIFVGEGWNTTDVTDSDFMFYGCTSLVGGQGTTFDPRHVDKAYAHIDGGPSNPGYFTEWKEAYACYTPSNTTLMFYYDNQRGSRPGTTYSLNTGSIYPAWYTDGTNANVTKVVFDPSFADARPTTTGSWFQNMENLQSITGMSYLNTSEVTYMAYMFYNCSGLTGIDLSHFNTSRVTTMRTMFGSCQALESLDLSHFNTSQVTNMEYMFSNCTNLRTIFADSGWSTAAVTYSSNMFSGCTSLVGGQGTTYSSSHVDKAYAHIDGGPSNPGYFTEWKEAYACYTPGNTTLTFYYDNQRNSRPGTTYDLNEGTYSPDWQIDQINSSVTNVVFDPSFANARPTTTLGWFYGMTKLQSITDLHYLNTDSVTNMGGMFWRCLVLESVDLSGFNTDNVTSMSQMFFYCSSLTSLDLSSFNTSKVTNMTRLFYACENLQTIYVGDGWSTDAVTTSTEMFNGCANLVGGQGTTYSNSNPKDKTYAHIDGGPSNPGYFTGNSITARGDVNGVGGVDMDDLTALINYLLTSDATGINLANAACCSSPDSTTVDMDDLTALINYLLTSTWP